MFQNSLVIFILIQVLTSANKLPCGEQRLQAPNGIIKFNTNSQENISCIWKIIPPEDTITSLNIFSFNFGKCKKTFSCCLSISSYRQVYLKQCHQKRDTFISLSMRENEIAVVLNTCGSSTNLWLDFSTRRISECPKSDFQCLDGSNCYNSSDICGNGFICNDHSDHLGCGGCNEVSTRCNNYSNFCFEISKRCDDTLNCPKGEDEMNCTTLCPQFKCRLEQKCITNEQICDRKNDCIDGFDEENCIFETKAPKILMISTMLIICSLCCTMFLCLIFRWIVTRRDVNRFMENLPDFPLAPFQGPGEEDSEASSSEALEAEFRSGGEFYEHYMEAIKKKSRSSKAIQVGGITPKYSHLELDGDNEWVVLASLNVPTDMCVGLSIGHSSSKNTITTLKSVRNNNDTSSSSCRDGPTIMSDTEPESYFNSELAKSATQRINKTKSNTSSWPMEMLSIDEDSKQPPSNSCTLVFKNTSKTAKPCMKLSSLGENSRSRNCFGGGDCIIQAHNEQLELTDAEKEIGTKSGTGEIKGEDQSHSRNKPRNNLVPKCDTSRRNLEHLVFDYSEPILKKNTSAPLPGTTKFETINRTSKSISDVREEDPEIKDDLKKEQQKRLEITLKSDSSQWTDFEDSVPGSKIILVKTIEEKLKPLKRSCRKKVGYS